MTGFLMFFGMLFAQGPESAPNVFHDPLFDPPAAVHAILRGDECQAVGASANWRLQRIAPVDMVTFVFRETITSRRVEREMRRVGFVPATCSELLHYRLTLPTMSHGEVIALGLPQRSRARARTVSLVREQGRYRFDTRLGPGRWRGGGTFLGIRETSLPKI